MKIFIFTIILNAITLNLFSQTEDSIKIEKKSSITIGILQGGGSLVGIDIETLIFKRFGLQFGGGYKGFGGGLNYHFKPSIRSSFISVQYWHQGIYDSFTQSVVGPNFVFRGEKWFTFQVGLGAPLKKGPAWPEDKEQPPVMLMYSIGFYLPVSH